MKKAESYHYDAFISYRHNEIDKFVAENIHRLLETYKLPKSIRKNFNIDVPGISRVFRDQEELPLASSLEDPIIEALKNSDYLIVICSPRLKESMWCKREIETFIKLHGRDRVLSVLVEGEPSESFPEEILYREDEVTDKSGKVKKVKTLCEPLALDVRGANKKAILKAIKKELLRLIAPMFNLNYDDLRQRHKERKMHQIVLTSMIGGAACLLLALYSTLMFIKINKQQNMLKLDQAYNLANGSLEDLENDERVSAIRKANDALTNYRGVKMPYTSLAEYALSLSLRVYDVGTSYKAVTQLDTNGNVKNMKLSPNRNLLLSYDSANELVLWDLKTNEKLNTIDDISSYSYVDSIFSFIGDDKYCYLNASEELVIINIKDLKVIKTIKIEDANSLISNEEGSFIAVSSLDSVYLINTKDYKLNNIYETKKSINQTMYMNKEYLIMHENTISLDKNDNDGVNLKIVSLKNNNISNIHLNSDFINEYKIINNNLYVLHNSGSNNKYVMHLSKINLSNNDITWTKDINDNFGTRLCISTDGKYIVASGAFTAYLLNDNGELLATSSIGDSVVGLMSSKSGSLFILFTRSGKNFIIDAKTGDTTQYVELFKLNCNDYKEVIASNYGYYATLLNDDRIINYNSIDEKDFGKVDKTYKLPNTMSHSDITKLSKKLDLDKANLVSGMVYSSDKELLFISYTDNTMDIYDLDKDKVVNTITDINDEIEYYFGKTDNDSYLVGGVSKGYIINKNYENIAEIEQLRGYDEKNDKLIVVNNDNYYAIPIYDLDDLIKMSEDYLK